MLHLFIALLPLFAHADDTAPSRVGTAPAASAAPAPSDIRTFSGADMAELASKIGKALHACKELKNGGQVEIAFTNSTSEFIDKDAFSNAIQAQLTPAANVPGRSYDLQVNFASTVKLSGANFEGVYTILAQLKQANEALCHKSSKLVKKGKITK